MRYLPLVLAAALVVALAPDANAEDLWSFDAYLKQKNVSDWKDLGVGTMVHRKGFQETSMPGAPTPQRQEMEEKKTLLAVNEDAFVIKVERKMMGQWQAEEKTQPKQRSLTHTVEDLGTETVTVDGTEYECTKKKVVWKDGEAVEDTDVLFVHPEKGILKMLTGDDQSMEITTAKFDQSWTIGDVTLEGREMAMTVTTPMGKMAGTVRISPTVPDGMVRQEMKAGQGGMQIHIVNELVAFVKK